MSKTKVLFFGTPDFAVPALEALCRCDEFEVVGVVSQPDRPKGRKMNVSPTPVKHAALEHGIPVHQPSSLKDLALLPLLEEKRPDLCLVIAYGRILPKYVLDFPKYGCINFHGSLLPKYRGAAPIQWAVINGEKITGVTVMLMNEGMDTGDVLYREETNIIEGETAGQLFDRLAQMCAHLAPAVLTKHTKGLFAPVKQQENHATYAPMITKDMARIDWSRSAVDIVNHIRGLNPAPVSFSEYKGQKFKVYEAEALAGNSPYGTIVEAGDRLVIAAGEGLVCIHQIQFENKRLMSVKEYLRGNTIEKGFVL